MNIEDKIKEYTMEAVDVLGITRLLKGGKWVVMPLEELTVLIQQEREKAVEDFVTECVGAFKTLTVNPNTPDNEDTVVEGFHYDTALTKMVPDMLIAFKNEYLSSSEKEESGGQDDIK